MITLLKGKHFSKSDLTALFHSVGWELETPAQVLVEAMQNATHIVSAWDGSKLVGIVRSMDDNVWSANIDCLVVHKDYQGTGVGTALLTELLTDIKHILCISVAPNEKKNAGFYQKFGFMIVADGALLQMYAD